MERYRDEGSEASEEFEAIWAVVRRLEAHIRRLEAAVATLQTEVQVLHAAGPMAEHARESSDSNDDDTPSAPVDEIPADDVAPSPAGRPVYRLVFDGGSLGNPGHGYGSYHVTSPRGGTLHEKLDFADRGDQVTNNQAEYLTLIRALEHLRDRLGERAKDAAVEIRGDSQLVINQLNGRWKVRNAELQPLFERARSILAEFGNVDLRWHERANSVEILGH